MKSLRIAAVCLLTLILLALFASYRNYARLDQVNASQANAPATITALTLQPFLTGLSSPIFVTNAHDGSNRLFIVEQTGAIRVLQPGSTTPTTFLNISNIIVAGGEQGLLGLAFHPQYATNGRFFVYFTRSTNASVQISEYHVSAANPNVADTVEIPLVNILHPTNTNHNGGCLAFGPDGYLYIGPGDGGSGNDPPNNAQNINQLLGKILRINVDVPNGAVPYSSPATNPFFGATAGADEIYMVGMRNPWRFSFDRLTGRLWIGDVGQGATEEVDSIDLAANPVTGARNGGWRVYEGTFCTNIDPCVPPTNAILPVTQYSHAGGRCSISGGHVYRGRRGAFPQGTYVFADYCTGEIFTWNGTTQTMVLDSPRNISAFGEDEAGELYAVGLGGTVERMTESTAVVPRNERADFDGDLRADLSVYRNGTWFVLNSFGNTQTAQPFGLATDKIVPGDYDGDGKTDVAVWRNSSASWYSLNSSNNAFRGEVIGASGDLPVAGDYDGDGRTDVAVFRPATGAWIVHRSGNGATTTQFWGLPTDVPLQGDFDGDGSADLAVWRNSDVTWYVRLSSTGAFSATPWGLSADKPVPADYDGDGKTDVAVFRSGTWHILQSAGNTLRSVNWGLGTDVAVPGDYDGDNKDDIAVFRNGAWYVLRSSTNQFSIQSWGSSGDVAVESGYVP